MAVGVLNKALRDVLRESEQRFRDYAETAFTGQDGLVRVADLASDRLRTPP
jgi:hypothetical protein